MISIRYVMLGFVAWCGCGLPGWTQQAATAPKVERLYAQAKGFQAQGDLPHAIEMYEQIVRADPGLAAAYNNLGSLYCDTGQYKKAIDVLRAGLRIDPKMSASYAVLGSAYMALGDYEHAAPQFETAVKTNPKDQRSEDLLEQALIALKDLPKAAERIRKRLQAEPDNQDAWYRLGNVYLQMSQDAHAKAITINPESPVALELRGEIQEGMGNLTQAQTKYEQAVKAGPDKPGTHEHLGNIYWVQGQWVEAQGEFEKELANDANNCRARWKLANCLLNENGDTQTALDDLNAAVARCPDLMQARVDRAKALVQMGRAADGLDDLLLAREKDPEEPMIHFLLAKVYRARGQAAEAASETALFGKLVEKNKHIPGAGTAPMEGSKP